MGHCEAGHASLAGFADRFEGEERGSGDELVAAQAGEEGDVAFVEDEAGFLPHPDEGAGQVDELAVAPPRSDGHGDDPVGAEQGGAAGEDGAHGVEQPGQPDVREVGSVEYRSCALAIPWPGRAVTRP
jgi:hypothetical protein